MLDGPPSQSNCDHWRAGCGETRTPRSGTGRRKRTPTRGTSPAAEFTRRAAWGNGPAVTPAPRPRPTQPEKAVVLCVDEKSQVQALDRTAPILPIMPGVPEKQTHDYVRNGTTTLFAALEVATGRIEQTCLPRHRHQEFLRFLTQVAKAYPRRRLHLVCDNYATHKHPAVTAWLARNKRITLHFTPTSGSWLNLVEIFFGIITRQAIRRGTFGSVRDLIEAITAFINGWNERCQPFVWTKDADTIIAKAHRKSTSATRH
jgi:transposase